MSGASSEVRGAEAVADTFSGRAGATQPAIVNGASGAGFAFVLALFLPEVPLRDTSRAGANDVGQGFGMPESADSDRQAAGCGRTAVA